MTKFAVYYPNDGDTPILYAPFKTKELAESWVTWMRNLDQLHDSSGEAPAVVIPLTRPPNTFSRKFKGEL